MNSLVKAEAVRCDRNSVTVDLCRGRRLSVPLAWFPRLLYATQAERERVTISSRAGRGDQPRSRSPVA